MMMNNYSLFAVAALVGGAIIGVGIYLMAEAGVFDPVSGPFGTGEVPTTLGPTEPDLH